MRFFLFDNILDVQVDRSVLIPIQILIHYHPLLSDRLDLLIPPPIVPLHRSRQYIRPGFLPDLAWAPVPESVPENFLC